MIASCNTPQLPAPTALASWSTALPDFVNAAAARRGRSGATSARQRRPGLQVDTFPRLDAPRPPAAAGRVSGADLVRALAHRPAGQHHGSVL
ncbi:hypothetical protein [Janthinobacterium sp. MDT1-19]|uniref:hypothetical protein n=1 Tax=Janthinobacterium sp. MDT1-19 TaxID=1259339 RepID=UPI003F219442